MDFLDFDSALHEVRGAMAPGRLKFTDANIVFKNSKTGKVEQIASADIDVVTWQRFAGHWGIRIFTKSGNLIRFGGFKESDKDKLSKFFTNHYDNTMLEKELCHRGWNWGTAKFTGSVLSFDVSHNLAFEVPLKYTSQCTTGKNEVTLEYHPNDDAPVSLMEMRFHIPTTELAGDDAVENFKEQVMSKASIISATGDAIAIFREVQCLTPRGRYDIKVFSTFFQLHGKTFDYKIPMSSVLRLFLLPHKDGRQIYYVVSLDPPIKQGQTRYHYVVFLFGQDEEEISIEISLPEEELATKYDGKLKKEMHGPMYEVLSKTMKAMVNRKITTPGAFTGFSGTAAVSCSYKATAGYMYPLEKGFIYVHKPPIHIRFEEISNVNFARSGGSTRSFDFEVEIKSGIMHTFSSIEKEEYPKLFDFISNKKLRVKNRGKLDKPQYAGDFDDSDAEGEPDAYLARVKAEAQERSDDGSEDEESEDEDFNPEAAAKAESDVAEEFDSDASSSGSDASGASDGSGGKKKKKPKKTKTVKERRPAKKKDKNKDENKPKRPQSAYFLWFNTNREALKKKYPTKSVTELSKKAGELWRDMKDKSEWEDKAKDAMEEYKKVMADYVPPADGGGGSSSKSKGSSSKGPSSKSSSKAKRSSGGHGSPTKSSGGGAGGGFKSKEFISDDDDSSDDADSGSDSGSKSKKKPPPSKAKSSPSKSKAKPSPAKKGKKEESDDEEEESAPTPTSESSGSNASGDDSD